MEEDGLLAAAIASGATKRRRRAEPSSPTRSMKCWGTDHEPRRTSPSRTPSGGPMFSSPSNTRTRNRGIQPRVRRSVRGARSRSRQVVRSLRGNRTAARGAHRRGGRDLLFQPAGGGNTVDARRGQAAITIMDPIACRRFPCRVGYPRVKWLCRWACHRQGFAVTRRYEQRSEYPRAGNASSCLELLHPNLTWGGSGQGGSVCGA